MVLGVPILKHFRVIITALFTFLLSQQILVAKLLSIIVIILNVKFYHLLFHSLCLYAKFLDHSMRTHINESLKDLHGQYHQGKHLENKIFLTCQGNVREFQKGL